MRKKITLFMTAIMALLIFTPVMSVEASSTVDPYSSAGESIETSGAPGIMSMEWEETEWIYATKDGYFWKRLWSITYGEWLGDWIRLAQYE